MKKTEGLTSLEVTEKQKLFGPNVLTQERPLPQWIFFIRQFKNPMVYLLGGAVLFSLFLAEYLNALAILSILLLNAIIGYFQESKAQSAMDALKKLTVPHTRVIRNGETVTISSEELVPEDLLQLEAGDLVPADARILKSYQLSSDESALTGESLPVMKTNDPLEDNLPLGEQKNMLFAGSAITSGSARAIVTKTGMDTELGKIAGLLNTTSDKKTPLQLKLKGISQKLILLCLVVIALVIVLRFIEGQPLVSILMDAISLAVAGIPEGLPTVVTLALALAMRRMVKRNAIVRDLAAVETLGSTTVICSDKTGTLTTGKMSVRNVYTLNEEDNKKLLHNLVLCNNASLSHGSSGDTTEVALLYFVQDQRLDPREIRKNFPRLHEWSFDSERRRMSVAVSSEEETIIYTKGAPESVLPLCKIEASDLARIKNKITVYSEEGQRLLVAATKTVPNFSSDDDIEKDLNFLGLVAMSDPPKEESLKAVKECQLLHIKVIMITGDHPVTAKAIARELGIIIPGRSEEVLTGPDLDTLKDEELSQKARDIVVYARVSPSHKMRIIKVLEAQGEIVAMTGDGVNDAPALKLAQIGVAMGKGGTEVARQAANMILTDDNFSTIVRAVEEGRGIYGNIRRTIQYQLSTNMAEILLVLGASLFALPVPFTPIGLLWINLVTDGLPSLALASEPLSGDEIQGSAPSPNTFIDKKFLIEMFLMGSAMTILALGLYYYKLGHGDQLIAKSYAFTMLVYLSIFRSFSCRSEVKSYFQLPINIYHLVSVIIPVLLQLFFQHTELYQRLLGVVPLSWRDLLVVAFFSSLPVSAIELWKMKRSHSY